MSDADVIEPVTKTTVHQGEILVTCEEVISFLLAYLSRDLSTEKAREFERHLAICPPCVAYMETYLRIVDLGKAAMAAPLAEAPAELGEDLTAAILAARRR